MPCFASIIAFVTLALVWRGGAVTDIDDNDLFLGRNSARCYLSQPRERENQREGNRAASGLFVQAIHVSAFFPQSFVGRRVSRRL